MSAQKQMGRFAVALGIGAAVLTGGAPPAWADPADSSDSGSSSTSDPSAPTDGAESSGSSESATTPSSTASPSVSGGDTSTETTPDDKTEVPKGIVDAQTNTSKSDTAEKDAHKTAVESKDPEPTKAADPTAEPTGTADDSPQPTTKSVQAKTAPVPPTSHVDATEVKVESSAAKAEPTIEKSESVAELATAEPATVETVVTPVSDPAPEPKTVTADGVSTAVGVAKVMTAMLNPLAAPVDSDSPVESPGLWTLLAFVRREFQSILFNSHPTASPIITSQTDDVVTGNIGAVDPDGDRLVYTVIGRGPALGRVSIDQATGAFTYTPVVDFSVLGGSDRFTVEISDETSPHLHGLDSLWEVPVNLIRGIPVIGSLVSDFLPRTSTTATVTIDFPGTGDLTDLKFPDGFHWGTSTSGFQSEMGGGAPLDENSDWWHWLHDPLNKGLLGWKSDALPENGPGSYLEYATDAELAADGVGADTFRMGIEWSRIFPNSTASVDISGGITDEVLEQLDALADQDEVAHYADVLSTLHAYQLDPMVTINHFTLPDWINDPESARIQESLGLTPQEKAGWVSDSTVSEFEKYSAYLAWKFGDEVTNWIVLNEPMNSMIPAYFAIPFTTGFPPAVLRPDLMAKGLLNQAAAYSASYDIIHQLDPDANVGAALSMWEWRGANPASAIDQQAAAQFSDFFNKWFPDAVIKGEVDANFDGVIEPDEIHPELAGRMDFFGVNYYGLGSVIGFGGSPFPSIPVLTGYPQFATLLNVLIGGCPAEECSDTPEVIKPSGLRDMIDIAASYGKPLWITENGLADADDSRRASYLVRHLAVVSNAIDDGVDIRGYVTWSLLDNLEWILGYEPKYGLYSFDPVTLERTPRSSVAVIHQITTTNSIPAELFQQYVKATGSSL